MLKIREELQLPAFYILTCTSETFFKEKIIGICRDNGFRGGGFCCQFFLYALIKKMGESYS
jgi:hypothetical protein